MFNMSSLYALPLPISRQAPTLSELSSHKSKRKQTRSREAERKRDDIDEEEEHDSDAYSLSQEPDAVLDPDERSQRRLARYTLLKPSTPAAPFPHKAHRSRTSLRKHHTKTNDDAVLSGQGLRVQHIAAMVAILHRCLQRKDWTRARRAFGLIMRSEISGQFIDIRATDLWGIGAEILFRQHPEPTKSYSLRGFESARSYYEKLIIRYPYHRNSPNSVNSIDFYLAMFSLWIYVSQAERSCDNEDGGSPHNALAQELREAAEISSRLEKVTAQSPFSDDEQFKRLKADVKLWHANLERNHREYSPVAANTPEDNLAADQGGSFPTFSPPPE